MEDLARAFRLASLRADELKKEVADSTDKTTADHGALVERLTAAVANEQAARDLLFKDILSAEKRDVEKSDAGKSVAAPNVPTKRGMTARIVPPKEYKHGENFSTWCSRFRRYLKIGKIDDSCVSELLLNSVDDRTLEKLEPVAEKLTSDERCSPDVFIPLFEQAMYPKSEIRALRQQLTNGKLLQEEGEDIDSFASRIRNIANRAYSEPSEKLEPCLNAFLNGIRDDMLYDKIVAVPGAEDDFELAVISARKFEKMRETRTTTSTDSDLLGVLQVEQNKSPAHRAQYSPAQYNRHTDTGRDDQRMSSRDDRRRQSYGSQPRNNGRNHNNRDWRDAPTSRDRSRRETRTCYRCNQQGHIARFCTDQRSLNSNRAGTSDQVTGPPAQ